MTFFVKVNYIKKVAPMKYRRYFFNYYISLLY